MTDNQEIITELREIRGELKHLSTQWDKTFAHREEVIGLRLAEHEKRLTTLESLTRSNERKLVSAIAIVSAAVVVAGLLVRLL